VAWEPDYVTAAELKAELGISDGVDDTWCASVVTAASRAVDRHCSGDLRRQFGQIDAAAVRYYRVTYRVELDRWVAQIDDLMTTTDLEVLNLADESLTGYVLYPRNAAADGRPWTRLRLAEGASYSWPDNDAEIAVTAKWGWSAVPATVKTATMMQAMRFYARRDSPYGVAGSPDLGSELRLLQKVDADVGVMLTGFVRPGATA
jgi:hypothetical protein